MAALENPNLLSKSIIIFLISINRIGMVNKGLKDSEKDYEKYLAMLKIEV